jgi:hypothetical protein
MPDDAVMRSSYIHDTLLTATERLLPNSEWRRVRSWSNSRPYLAISYYILNNNISLTFYRLSKLQCTTLRIHWVVDTQARTCYGTWSDDKIVIRCIISGFTAMPMLIGFWWVWTQLFSLCLIGKCLHSTHPYNEDVQRLARSFFNWKCM